MSDQEQISRELKGIKWATVAGAAAQADMAFQARKQTQLMTNMLESQEQQAALERKRKSEVADARRLLVKIEGLCLTLEHFDAGKRSLSSSARYFVELGLLMRRLDPSVFDELIDFRSHAEAQRRVNAISALSESEGGLTCEQQAQKAEEAVANLIHAAMQLQPPDSVQIERLQITRTELGKANAALKAWTKILPVSLRSAVDAGIQAVTVGAVVSDEHADQVALNGAFLQLPPDLQPLLKLILAGAHTKVSDSQLFDVSSQVIKRTHAQIAPYNEALAQILVLAGEIVRACEQGNKASARAALKSISSLGARIDVKSVDEYKNAVRVYERRWRIGSLLISGVLIAIGFLGIAALVVGLIRASSESGKVADAKQEASPLKDISPTTMPPAIEQSSTVSMGVESRDSAVATMSDASTSITATSGSASTSGSARGSDEQREERQVHSLPDQSKIGSVQTRFGTFSVKDGQLNYNNRPVRDRNNVLISGDVVDMEKAISLSHADVILVHTNCAGSSCSDFGDTRFVSVTSTELNASQSFGYGRAILFTNKAATTITVDYGQFGKAVYDNGQVEVAPTLVR